LSGAASANHLPGSSEHLTVQAKDLLARLSRTTPRSAALGLCVFVLAALGGLVYLTPNETSARLLALGGLVLPMAWLLYAYPELGVVAICFFTADLVPRDLVSASIGGLGIDAADATLLGVLAVFVLHGLRSRSLDIPQWPMIGPLLLFAGLGAFSAIYARFYQNVNLGLVMGELRPIVYGVGCTLGVLLLTRRQQLARLLIGLFVVADATAGALVIQEFVGPGHPLVPVPPEGIWQVDQMASGGFASLRLVPPGHALLYLMLNVAICLLLMWRSAVWLRALLVLHIFGLSLAMLLTYTRAQWVASAIALLLIVILLPPASKKALARFLLPVVSFLALGFVFAGADVFSLSASSDNPLIDRAASIATPEETLNTSSLQWRVFEADAVFRALSEQPFLGVGLGNNYRDVTLLAGEASGWLWDLDGPARLTRFVHNSYLYMAVKLGLVALGVFFWFCVAFVVTGTIAYFRSPNGWTRAVVLGVVCSLIGLLQWAIFEPQFMLPAGVATLGVMTGLVACVSAMPGGQTPHRLAPSRGLSL
jgi:O-antigen ligase